MTDPWRVELRALDGGPTALGWAGRHTIVADRPAAAGGRGLGFNGGQLLYLAIGACYSNDLYREAAGHGVRLTDVQVVVDGDFAAPGEPSGPIEVRLLVSGEGSEAALAALVEHVDRIAEIPNSLRGTTPVTVVERTLRPVAAGEPGGGTA